MPHQMVAAFYSQQLKDMAQTLQGMKRILKTEAEFSESCAESSVAVTFFAYLNTEYRIIE